MDQAFDTAQAIDALLQIKAGENILEVQLAGLAYRSIDLDSHASGQSVVSDGSIAARVALVGAELVEITVGRDVGKRRWLLVCAKPVGRR